MGGPKGGLLLDGATLAERAARTLWGVCGGVLISLATNEGSNPAPGFPAIRDDPPAGRGPLAGILAACRATGSADLVVLACDYPFVDAALLAALVDSARDEDALVMPTDPAGRDHPLVALWKRGAELPVQQALDEGRNSVRALFYEIEVRRLGAAALAREDLARVLSNWNRPEDAVIS